MCSNKISCQLSVVIVTDGVAWFVCLSHSWASFNALTLLVWWQMICIWSSWCHCHPIISCFSKIENGLPIWCRPTQVVLEKRPLNGCSSIGSHSWALQKTAEPIEMLFGMWIRVGPRKRAFDGVHIGATWRIRLSGPCGALMQPLSNYFDQLTVICVHACRWLHMVQLMPLPHRHLLLH